MDDLLQHFIVEARELVQQATEDLLALEREPSVAAHLDSAFRAVHTLKGSVGLFDLAPMGLALHAAEDLLGALRERKGGAGSGDVDILLACIGQTEHWIGAIESTGRLPPDAGEEGYRLARTLRSQLDGDASPETPTIPEADIGWIEELIADNPGVAALRAQNLLPVAIRYIPRSDCFFAGDDPLALMRSVPDLIALRFSIREPWPPAGTMDPFSCNLRIDGLSRAGHDAVKAVFRFVPDQVTIHEVAPAASAGIVQGGISEGDAANRSAPDAVGSRTLRIEAARIDRLADLVGEMIVAKNALAHLAVRGGEAKDLIQGIQASQVSIERLVAEMHRAVMDVRMMPMRDIFRRFPRAVRDIAGQLDKPVDFAMEGEGIEADKSVVEGLFEPLLHVLRNAVSHGAEPESLRREMGKPASARIVLRARRDGDRVTVEVEDDGRGIDPAAIRAAARERGLASEDRIERMSEAEALDLIFSPGFSTAAQVTDLSGRGVGMDAVRSAVERLGGRIHVESRQGRGTIVRFSLPMTVILTKVMAVRVGGELYGFPIDRVVETTFVPAARILAVGDAEAFVLRDRTLPLVRLGDLLGISRRTDPGPGAKVLVMWVQDEPVGIAVDGFAERMDVLMRPMSGILADFPGVMGTTLLGDGSVLMILDIAELIG